MEPNIYQMDKWLEEQERHLREACRRAVNTERSSTKRPALGPVLAWLKRPHKGGGIVPKGR